MQTPSAHGHPWIYRASTLLLGCIVSLLIVEAMVRLLGLQGDVFKRLDPQTYVAYTPGATGLWISQADHQIRTRVRINSTGYRGPEFPAHAEPTIAFVGDSFTAAMQVPYEECFVAQTQALLQSSAPLMACLNFGIDGTGTGIQLAHLRRQVLPRTPAAVVLQFTIGPDFADNSNLLSWKSYYPSWKLEDGRLLLRPPSMKPPRVMNLARHSRAAGWLFSTYRQLVRPRREGGCEETWLYRTDGGPIQEQIFDVTGALLSEFAEETRRAGAVPLLLVVPTPCQIETGWAAESSSSDPYLPLTYLQSRVGESVSR